MRLDKQELQALSRLRANPDFQRLLTVVQREQTNSLATLFTAVQPELVYRAQGKTQFLHDFMSAVAQAADVAN